MLETAGSSAKRQQAKQERRARIIRAATQLLRERDADAVTVSQIAERCELAPATLYNLFMTKGAILGAVFDHDMANFRARVASQATVPAIDQMFGALNIAATLYSEDPQFYRAMAKVTDDAAQGLPQAIGSPRVEFWVELVSKGVIDGSFKPSTPPAMVGLILAQLTMGIFLDWASGHISSERFELQASYGFSLVLHGLASAPHLDSLETRATTLAQALSVHAVEG